MKSPTKHQVLLIVSLACVTMLGVWILHEPRVEVHGRFSAQDVAALKKLGRTENRQAIKSDWSRSRRNFPQLTRIVRRLLSEHVVRIEQEPNDKAVVTVGTGRAESSDRSARYLFVKSGPGWKLAPVEFE